MPVKKSTQLRLAPPTAKVEMLKAWSFSRLMTWDQCPFKLFLSAIKKIREPEREVLIEGQDAETEILKYITKAKGANKCPERGEAFKEALGQLRTIARRIVIKKKFTFTSGWTLTDWFAQDAWLRVELDLFYEEQIGTGRKAYWRVHIIDLKTGKIYEDKVCQVELYNLVVLLLPEGILTHSPKAAYSELWYLDQGETRDAQMFATDIEAAKDKWADRIRPMMSAKTFEPRPTHMCRWCFYRKDNKANGGGQCRF